MTARWARSVKIRRWAMTAVRILVASVIWTTLYLGTFPFIWWLLPIYGNAYAWPVIFLVGMVGFVWLIEFRRPRPVATGPEDKLLGPDGPLGPTGGQVGNPQRF
jgi:hypothetical protein